MMLNYCRFKLGLFDSMNQKFILLGDLPKGRLVLPWNK